MLWKHTCVAGNHAFVVASAVASVDGRLVMSVAVICHQAQCHYATPLFQIFTQLSPVLPDTAEVHLWLFFLNFMLLLQQKYAESVNCDSFLPQVIYLLLFLHQNHSMLTGVNFAKILGRPKSEHVGTTLCTAKGHVGVGMEGDWIGFMFCIKWGMTINW